MAEAAEGGSPSAPLSEMFDAVPNLSVGQPTSPDGTSKPDTEKGEGDQKYPESDASQKPEDKPADDAKDKEEDGDEPEEDEKDEGKDKPDPSKEKEDPSKDKDKSKDKPEDKWDSDENPYKKRFGDTAANWNKEHQQNLALQNQLAQMQREVSTLRKIADGTYDPEKDDPAKQVSPEDIASRALNVGKVLSSKRAAIEQFGADKVNSDLAEFNSVFEGHELVNNLVLSAESPIHEAFRILNRYRFEKKYGSTPEEWHKSIRAEAEKELRDTITKEVTDKLLGRAAKKDNTPSGLSSSRGSNGLGSGQNSKGKKGPLSLDEILK